MVTFQQPFNSQPYIDFRIYIFFPFPRSIHLENHDSGKENRYENLLQDLEIALKPDYRN